MNVDISIIIPIYNSGAFLSSCLDSILSQGAHNIEIILVDDGSTDDSYSQCIKYVDGFSNVDLVLCERHCGVSEARNKGLDRAKGKWIMFIDADDYLLPESISHFLNLVDSHKDCTWFLASTLKELNEVKSIHKALPQNEIYDPITKLRSIRRYAVWGYLFSHSIIKKYGIRFHQGLGYSEDKVFIYKYALYNKRLVTSNQYVYVYRLHGGSACASRDLLRKAINQVKASSVLFNLSESSEVASLPLAKQSLRREYEHTLSTGIRTLIVDFSVEKFRTFKNAYVLEFHRSKLGKLYFLLFVNYILYCWHRFIHKITGKN